MRKYDTERELLELAAKAAKIELRWSAEPDYSPRIVGRGFVSWNPLNDDGDAFRLASAMGMTVEFGNNLVLHPGDFGGDGTDPLEATRQAIVKAAAYIGKAMS